MPLTEKKPLSSNAIKLIAIAAMTVDHIAWAVFPGRKLMPAKTRAFLDMLQAAFAA